jgi:hypothetical protein
MKLNPQIQIHQIYFNDEQIPLLDSSAQPYNNSKDTSKECEYGVMRREYFNGNLDFNKYNYIGFISWKWLQKTKLPLIDFIKLVNEDYKIEGYDVYSYNPFPWAVRQYYNIWKQGDTCPGHKDISKYTQTLFNKLGHKVNLLENYHTVGNAAYCNYWIGNEKFWKSYINYMEPFRDLMLNSEEYGLQNYQAKDPLGFYPYVIERLWTEFINTQEIKYKIFNPGE